MIFCSEHVQTCQKHIFRFFHPWNPTSYWRRLYYLQLRSSICHLNICRNLSENSQYLCTTCSEGRIRFLAERKDHRENTLRWIVKETVRLNKIIWDSPNPSHRKPADCVVPSWQNRHVGALARKNLSFREDMSEHNGEYHRHHTQFLGCHHVSFIQRLILKNMKWRVAATLGSCSSFISERELSC